MDDCKTLEQFLYNTTPRENVLVMSSSGCPSPGRAWWDLNRRNVLRELVERPLSYSMCPLDKDWRRISVPTCACFVFSSHSHISLDLSCLFKHTILLWVRWEAFLNVLDPVAAGSEAVCALKYTQILVICVTIMSLVDDGSTST